MPVLAAVPMRGGLPTAVPTDPTIYRFYEVLQVYGGAIKELIHEEFGEILTVFSFFTVFSVFRRTVHRPVNATCIATETEQDFPAHLFSDEREQKYSGTGQN